MADYETLYPGRFIRAADLKGKDVTMVIVGVVAEEIDGKAKAVMTFEGTKKSLVLNRTNAEAVRLMFGRETDDWLGKRVTIFPAVIKDPFGDGEVGAIRVRGSPDIAKAAEATVQRGRKTIRVSVMPTGRPAAAPKGNGKAPPRPTEMSAEEKAAAIAKEHAMAEGEPGSLG